MIDGPRAKDSSSLSLPVARLPLERLIEQWRAKAQRRYDDAERLRGVEEDVRADRLEARADENRAAADELAACLGAPKETCQFRLPVRKARCAELFPDDQMHWCGACLMEVHEPERFAREVVAAVLPPQQGPIDNGNPYIFCDAVSASEGCVRGAGHNGSHAFCKKPYPQIPVMLRGDAVLPPSPQEKPEDLNARVDKGINRPGLDLPRRPLGDK